MSNYFYIAKDEKGKTKKGMMQSENTRDLAQELKNIGLVLIEATLQKERRGVFGFFRNSFKVSITEKLMITRNLQVMISTGLPLVKAFLLLAGQAKNNELKKALLDIKDKIGKGEKLGVALGKYPEIFSELFVNMIDVGDVSGNLEEVLGILSLQLEREHQLKSKIRRAMIYPAILLSVMLLLGGIVMVVFIPGLKKLFEGVNVELPIYTKALIASGDFMVNYWYFIVLFIFFLIPIIVKLINTKKGRIIKDTILINFPLFSNLVKKSNSASLIRSLSSLISSGVPIVQSLEITSRTVSNFYFERVLINAAQRVKTGEKLFNALKTSKDIFPLGALETIEIGEETGETAGILKKLAEFYEQEVMDITDNLSILVEPILITGLGAAVGIFAFAVISPLYSVLSSIQ